MEKHRRGRYELYGECLTFKELAKLAGVSLNMMRYRLGKCGSIEETLRYTPPTKCSVKGCTKKLRLIKGLCRKHYAEQYNANKRRTRLQHQKWLLDVGSCPEAVLRTHIMALDLDLIRHFRVTTLCRYGLDKLGHLLVLTRDALGDMERIGIGTVTAADVLLREYAGCGFRPPGCSVPDRLKPFLHPQPRRYNVEGKDMDLDEFARVAATTTYEILKRVHRLGQTEEEVLAWFSRERGPVTGP
jgi:hypothetical protein